LAEGVSKLAGGAIPGRPGVWSAYRIPVGDRFEVARIVVGSFRETPTQGICLRLDGGQLEVNGQVSDGLVLWTDTSPELIEVGIFGEADSVLEVWNCWRGRYGERQAWLGDAGMVIEVHDGKRYLFGCSGPGEAQYTDLVFELELSAGVRRTGGV
jgi:hypothetical protein